jgi:hypothetical protein
VERVQTLVEAGSFHLYRWERRSPAALGVVAFIFGVFLLSSIIAFLPNS